MTHWQNRIIGEGIEAPDQLLANPANWRIHPKPQQDALTSVLDTVGWVQRVIVNKRTGHIVDGHLRVEMAISRNEPGVPTGWRAYANRAYTADVEHLEAGYALACERAGTEEIVYMVYVGRKPVQDVCVERGWAWVPEDSYVKHGR